MLKKLELFFVNIVFQWKSFVELVKVARRYYFNLQFLKVDQALLLSYFFRNPFQISKHFLLSKGEEDVYVYGETPLTSIEQLAKECGIKKEDTVFDLGCGRGRGCFWLNIFTGCRVVGVEHVPEFVEKASAVQKRYDLTGIEFRLEDILEVDLDGATVIYLYGTCYEEPFIKKLIQKFEKLPLGTKIISVSYPLTDYTDKKIFEVMKHFTLDYSWGEASVYLQIRV